MKIKRLVIENFKSIERIELIEPNPFTVFVGPNGSGKSNIFEALEFVNLRVRYVDAVSLFGGLLNISRRQNELAKFDFQVTLSADREDVYISFDELTKWLSTMISNDLIDKDTYNSLDLHTFLNNFSRLFVRNDRLVKLVLNDNQRLSLDAKNLEKVLRRILSQPSLKEEIFEWLDLFIPEFKSVEVVANPFSGEETLLWYEQYAEKPFTKDLISDGTYNILAMLTAVYQSDEPQFLCIEEPENGLHPEIIMTLVEFFRKQCEEKGHYIWLNTHSTSVVSKLRPDEIVLVEKKEGATQIRQVGNRNLYDLEVDYAWLSGALGGGLPW